MSFLQKCRVRPIPSFGLIAGIAVLLILIVAGPAFQPKDKQMVKLIHRFLSQHEIPGAVVAYGWPNQPPDLYAFGLADPEAGRAMSVSDRFKLASLSKTITSAAILELIRSDETLDLSTTLASFFPQIENSVDPRMKIVTVQHLLHHSTGWDRTIAFDPFFLSAAELEARLQLRLRSSDDCAPIAEAMLRQPLQFNPGQAYAYSNIGYCWLGRILEERTGAPYEQAVRSLLRQGAADMSLEADSVGVMHAVAPKEAEFAALRPQIIAAAGGWIGSAEDYFTFAAHPLDSKIFSPPSFAEGTQFYGLGWRIWQFEGGTILTHYGSMPGVFSMVARAPDGPVFVALFNGRPKDDLGAFRQLFGSIMSLDLLASGKGDR